AATLTVSVVSGPSPFTNGSFENGYTGWTATGTLAVAVEPMYAFTDGVRAVAFNLSQRAPDGVLSQTFATTAGQTYLVTFDLGAFSYSTQDEQRMQLTIRGSGGGTLASK